MKVYGGATGMKYEQPIASAMQTDGFTDYERALRYALGLPGVGTAVVGVFSEEELEQNIEWVRRYQPLTVEEEEYLRSQGRQIARQWGPPLWSRRRIGISYAERRICCSTRPLTTNTSPTKVEERIVSPTNR